MNKETLKKEISKLSTKLYNIQIKEKIEKNSQLIGRCFKYKNSYSCPEKPNDYWWLYIKVIRINEYGCTYALSFRKDNHGSIEIIQNNYISIASGGYVEITNDEFNKKFNELKKEIIGL